MSKLVFSIFFAILRPSFIKTKMDFKNLSLIELSELIKSGKTTSKEVCDYFFARVKQYNTELNAFNTLPDEKFSVLGSQFLVDENAQNIEHRTQNQAPNLPIAVKDIFCEA